MDSCSILTLYGTSLKNSGDGKCSQWVELQALHLVLHSCSEGEMVSHEIILANGVWPVTCLDGQGLGKDMTGKLIENKFGKEACG